MIGVTKTYLPSRQSFDQYLDKIWDTGWVTSNGQLTKDLTTEMVKYLNVPFLNLVSSGTLGLQIAIKVLNLEGEIITTAFSYVATTSSIAWLSLKPIFVDIEADSFNIDPSKIEAAIGPKTKAILAAHVFGNPCDIETIQEIADRNNLTVIYDAAPAFGVKYKKQSLLNYGDLSILSLHATKVFHTTEGGAIISHKKEIAERIAQITNFGHKGDDEGFFGIGINGKLSELHAAMGLSVLPFVKELTKKRKAIHNLYNKQLSSRAELHQQKIKSETEYNYAYYPLVFPSEDLVLKVKSNLKGHGFHARRYFYPALSKLPYTNTPSMPIAENIASRILCLPLSHEMNKFQIDHIVNIILTTLDQK